jgi:hypothetical protein
MKIHLISYASRLCLTRKPIFIRELKQFSKIDKWKIYTLKDLDKNFREKYKNILFQPRLGGYGIWKPYIIADYLKTIPQGDILFYTDIGCTLNNSKKAYTVFDDYVELAQKHSILRFGQPYKEICWNNSTIINYIAKKYSKLSKNEFSKSLHSTQPLSGVIGMKKGDIAVEFFNELLKILEEDPNLYTDFYNKINPHKEYIEHRHDQSVFSLLFKCLNIGIIIRDLYTNSNPPIISTRKRIEPITKMSQVEKIVLIKDILIEVMITLPLLDKEQFKPYVLKIKDFILRKCQKQFK